MASTNTSSGDSGLGLEAQADESWRKFKSSDVILNPDKRTEEDPPFLYRFHVFRCETKRCKDYEWYIGSKDWKDGRKCRKCTHSVMPSETFLGLTPYQGDSRVFGLFRCQKCRRFWKSSFSWANTPQECETCEIDVYPYKQCYLSWNSNQDEGEEQGSPKRRTGHGSHMIRVCEICNSSRAVGNCLCLLRAQGGRGHPDGRCSENSSSGVSSAEQADDDVIEVSLKSIEEAESLQEKQSRIERRRRFYLTKMLPRIQRARVTQACVTSTDASTNTPRNGSNFQRPFRNNPMPKPEYRIHRGDRQDPTFRNSDIIPRYNQKPLNGIQRSTPYQNSNTLQRSNTIQRSSTLQRPSTLQGSAALQRSNHYCSNALQRHPTLQSSSILQRQRANQHQSQNSFQSANQQQPHNSFQSANQQQPQNSFQSANHQQRPSHLQRHTSFQSADQFLHVPLPVPVPSRAVNATTQTVLQYVCPGSKTQVELLYDKMKLLMI